MVKLLVALNMDPARWDCDGTTRETQPRYLTHVKSCLDSHPCQSVGYPHFIRIYDTGPAGTFHHGRPSDLDVASAGAGPRRKDL